jgi:hypothetical protein
VGAGRTEKSDSAPLPPARTIKTCIAVAAAAAAVSFGFAAAVAGSAGAAQASAVTTGSGGGAAVQYAQIRGPQDDPHTYFDNGDNNAVLCATAIEYGLIAAQRQKPGPRRRLASS